MLRTLLLFAFVASAVGDDPRVKILATDPPVHPVEGMVIQKKDKDVQFTCIVENKPVESQVQWIVIPKGGTQVVQVSSATRSYDAFRWSIDNPSSTAWRLRISNAQVTDEGVYKCRVQVTSQNYATDETELKIVQVPQISDLVTSSDMTKKWQDEAVFSCEATGRPTPTVTWSRLAGELLPTGGTEYRGNEFKIQSVESDHAGVYKCTASNSAGRVERRIRLTVNFPPAVTPGSAVYRQAPGYVKELVCEMKGYPQPSHNDISWTGANNRPIKTEGRFQVRTIPGAYNKVTSILVINGVKEEDFAQYKCAAKNSYGSDSARIRLERSTSGPTVTRNGQVRSGAGALSISLATLLMLLSVCLLHRHH